jgi:6,7-dimethyl-8-ribityllumazine synthase
LSRDFQGDADGRDLSLAVVVSRFNRMVTDRLLAGARKALKGHGVDPSRVDFAHVPGSFELPLAAHRLAESGRYEAVVCLGAVIRGETPHFEYVAAQSASGIARVTLDTGVPVIFGVVTADTLEQALDRAGGRSGNKGFDAVVTAIEMANLMKRIDATGGERALPTTGSRPEGAEEE